MKLNVRFYLTAAFLSVILLMPLDAYSADGDSNQEIFDRVYEQVKDSADIPCGRLAVLIAKQFLGTPYVAGSIEREPEDLTVFLDRTDCMLFVEMIYSFALAVKGLKIVPQGGIIREEPSFPLLCSNIRAMRYRGGKVQGYSSRIHYTSEWILQNHSYGTMTEITPELGVVRPQEFSFMSTHTDSYSQLKDNPSEVHKIREVEVWLQMLAPYWYVPQSNIQTVSENICDGDILFFVSKTKGLDIVHAGIAVRQNGEMHFIHASSRAGKVIIESKTLADYAVNGIRIVRPIVDKDDLTSQL